MPLLVGAKLLVIAVTIVFRKTVNQAPLYLR